MQQLSQATRDGAVRAGGPGADGGGVDGRSCRAAAPAGDALAGVRAAAAADGAGDSAASAIGLGAASVAERSADADGQPADCGGPGRHRALPAPVAARGPPAAAHLSREYGGDEPDGIAGRALAQRQRELALAHSRPSSSAAPARRTESIVRALRQDRGRPRGRAREPDPVRHRGWCVSRSRQRSDPAATLNIEDMAMGVEGQTSRSRGCALRTTGRPLIGQTARSAQARSRPRSSSGGRAHRARAMTATRMAATRPASTAAQPTS